jgi:hypothetical protein
MYLLDGQWSSQLDYFLNAGCWVSLAWGFQPAEWEAEGKRKPELYI